MNETGFNVLGEDLQQPIGETSDQLLSFDEKDQLTVIEKQNQQQLMRHIFELGEKLAAGGNQEFQITYGDKKYTLKLSEYYKADQQKKIFVGGGKSENVTYGQHLRLVLVDNSQEKPIINCKLDNKVPLMGERIVPAWIFGASVLADEAETDHKPDAYQITKEQSRQLHILEKMLQQLNEDNSPSQLAA